MSQENVELVHKAIDAFNRRDIVALADFCADDFEFVSVLSAVEAEGSTHRGEDAWSGYFARMDDTWEEWWVDDFQVFDAGGDSAVAVVRVAGKGRQSGATVDRSLGMTYRLRQGKLWRMRAYLDPADALEAVGLSE